MGGDSTGAESTGTHIHMDNTRGHANSMGTCLSFLFFCCAPSFPSSCSIVKVPPQKKKRKKKFCVIVGGFVEGFREGILTPSHRRKINKFALNDFSDEFWDKGSPAETGRESIRSFKRCRFGEGVLLMGENRETNSILSAS